MLQQNREGETYKSIKTIKKPPRKLAIIGKREGIR